MRVVKLRLLVAVLAVLLGAMVQAGCEGAATIRGAVSVAPDIFPQPQGDLAGALLVGVLTGPIELGGSPAALSMTAADLASGTATFEVADVVPGRYLVTALLDDNENYDPQAPGPDGWDVYNPISVPVELEDEEVLELDLVLTTPVPPAEPVCGEEPLDATGRQCVFDFVWELADRYYPFFDQRAIDWDAVRAEYEPQLGAPATDEEFVRLMMRFVAELEDGHSSVSAPSVFEGLSGTIEGLALAQVDGVVYVERADAGTAAAVAGLQAGDVVETIDGVTFAAFSAENGDYVPRCTDQFHLHRLLALWPAGDPAAAAEVAITRSGAPMSMTVPRSTPSAGDTFVSSRRITGTSGAEYGYIAMAGFYLEAAPEISAALDSLMDVAGLVIDVRGNSGGLSAVGDALMGRLLDAPTEGERLHFRGVPTEYAVTTIEPVAPVYSGPVVVLIDEGSYSEGHVLPGLLREIGRATLVGRATGGGNGTPEPWQLTTAMGVSVSTWMTALASGAVDEVTGTEPDVEVVRTAADILDGLYTGPGDPEHDIVLRTALEELGD